MDDFILTEEIFVTFFGSAGLSPGSAALYLARFVLLLSFRELSASIRQFHRPISELHIAARELRVSICEFYLCFFTHAVETFNITRLFCPHAWTIRELCVMICEFTRPFCELSRRLRQKNSAHDGMNAR